LLVVAAALLTVVPCVAKKLRVRGTAVIDARAVVLPDGFEVRGSVRDDAGRPLGATVVKMKFEDAAQVAVPEPTACAPTTDVRALKGPGDAHLIETNGAGAFCARVASPRLEGAIVLEVPGQRDVDGARNVLKLDTFKRSLGLQFTPEPRSLALEQAQHLITVDTRVHPPDSALTELVTLTLLLVDRSRPAATPKELGSATVRAGELARFQVESAKLGMPGPATLQVRFAGSQTLGSSEHSAVVERTARVELHLPNPLPLIDASDGVALDVRVGSRVGPVPGGSLEASIGDQSVGTAAVTAGQVQVLADFESPHAAQIALTLTYHPGAPWWIAPPPTVATLNVAPPSPWRRLPWLIAAVGIALWVVRGWRRPARRAPMLPLPEAAAPTGRAALDVVEIGPPRSGWRGRVVDAHDGTPLASATLRVQTPSFERPEPSLELTTDEHGEFHIEFDQAAASEGTQLHVSSHAHSALVRTMPPQGQVVIQLVSRRRAVLDGLVGWAKRRGQPWTLQQGEPTPGDVARTARHHGDDTVERWAAGVEDAAFGPTPPDEAIERALRDGEPR
jgi:hypothetical protein